MDEAWKKKAPLWMFIKEQDVKSFIAIIITTCKSKMIRGLNHLNQSSENQVSLTSYFSRHHKFGLLLCGFEYLERTHQCFINTHHGTSIVKFTTVIWSREYGNKLSISKKLITILNNLHKNKVSHRNTNDWQ